MGQCMSSTGSALPAGVGYVIYAETLRCFTLPVGCRWFIKRFALIALSVSGARERVRWFIERFSLIALNDS